MPPPGFSDLATALAENENYLTALNLNKLPNYSTARYHRASGTKQGEGGRRDICPLQILTELEAKLGPSKDLELLIAPPKTFRRLCTGMAPCSLRIRSKAFDEES